MKWLFYEKETDTKAKVMMIYNVEPPKELISNGNYITVDNIEEPEQKTGKTALPYCNPETGDFWYEYVDKPLSSEEQLQEQINALNIAIAEIMGVQNMPAWKKNIFVNAIKARMEVEDRTVEDIIQDYPKLTEEEKVEILAEI